MAGNEIRYNVKVDASGANRALTSFGRAAEKAGKDATEALDDTASAGDKARAALTAMATAMDAELREAAAAADALRIALGDAGAQLDPTQIVADLNRMGVSFDEIRADADKFAATLREVDGIRVQGVNDGLGKTKEALDGVRNNADQSRSVLANMAGNAAQDLGELGGVTGTLGVGLGQLAEYATEGNISLSNLASVAGPMAGVAVATLAVTSAMKNMAETDAFNKKQVEDFQAAIEESGAAASTLENHIRELHELTGRVGQDSLLGGFLSREETVDASAALAEFGFTLNDVIRLVGSSNQEQLAFRQAMIDSGMSTDDANDAISIISQTLLNWETAVKGASTASEFFASTTGDVNAALADQQAQTGLTAAAWKDLLADLQDGHIDTERATGLWNQLRDELGLTNDEMAELVQQKLAEKLEADGEAAAAAADEIETYRDAVLASRDAVKEYDRATGSREWGRAGIEGATEAYEEYRQLVTGDRQRVADSEEAWDGLGGAIEASGESLLDLQSPEGRAVFDALDELGTSIVPDLAKAFDDSNGDINTFRRSTDRLATQTLTRLQDEFGIGEEQARLMIAELGLMPEQVETFYKLAGDAEAKLQLDLLQGYIDSLPEEVQTDVALQIIQGDYQGAVSTVQSYAANHPANMTLILNTEAARAALAALRRTANSIASVFSFSPSMAMAPAPAGYAAPAPVVTTRGVGATSVTPVNVHVHTAVIGDRYDVQRVIGRAVAGAVRLNGVRR